MKALIASLCLVVLTLGCVSDSPDAEGEGAVADGPITVQPLDSAQVSGDPAVAASAEELACMALGNLWVRSGQTELFACVRPTGDAGKSCRRGSECEGECLARSMSCAPFDPLLGCNDILQDNGLRVTLCLN